MWCARRRPSALGAWDAASAWRPVWKASLTRNCAGPSLRALASRARRADRVHASASVHPSATVGAGAVVGPNAWVGPKCVLGPNVVVGAGVIVGGGTVVGPNTTLLHCALGAGCTLHAGVNIGADGFGFIPGIPASTEPWPDNAALTATAEGRGSPHANRLGVVLPGDQPPIKKPQLRRVVIGDDVEIGAGSCIDRGSWRDTVVGHHTKLDNLVQARLWLAFCDDYWLIALACNDRWLRALHELGYSFCALETRRLVTMCTSASVFCCVHR